MSSFITDLSIILGIYNVYLYLPLSLFPVVDPFSAPLETEVELELFVLPDFWNPSNTLASGELGTKCKRSE